MRVGQDVLSNLRAALGTEWVLPHGTGGSSSGTASGANARRAHALLAAVDGNGRRSALLLKVDEKLRGPGVALELGCNVLTDGSVLRGTVTYGSAGFGSLVPEPGTMVMLLLGCVPVMSVRRRRVA